MERCVTEKFADWVNQINGDGFVCNLFMDYETFGEHQWEDTGTPEALHTAIGQSIRYYEGIPPETVFNYGTWSYTPEEMIRSLGPPKLPREANSHRSDPVVVVIVRAIPTRKSSPRTG